MAVAIVLAVGCLLVSVFGWWWYLTRDQRHIGKARPGAGPQPSATAAGPQGPPPRRGQSMPHGQHRWSALRPRLELTVGELRETGQQIRFCLDCAAEEVDDRPSSEMEPQ